MEPSSKTVSVECLNCDWSIGMDKPGFRPKAYLHAIRKGHKVKLVTVNTVIYSDRVVYRSRKKAA